MNVPLTAEPGAVLASTSVDAPTDVIDADVPCAACGYNLRSSRRDGVCPECGVPVARSLGRDNPLWEARPAWLRSLSCGVIMMIAAQVLTGALLLASSSLGPWFDDERVGFSCMIAVTTLYAAGGWILTRRERLYVRPTRRNWTIRWIARFGLFGPVFALGVGMSSFTGSVGWFSSGFTVGLIMASLGMFIPGMLAIFLYLRGLARRVLSRRMSEYATIVAVGGGLTATAIFTMAVLGTLDIRVDASREVGLVVAGVLAVSIVLFYLWSLLVLILFAVAFARASRKARLLWDERAAPA